ncbi:MAG: 3,4-dihydroxy-2-butanone-4-phosphate synthase [Rhodospirillales bacterium]|nr:3,4-dihydroxy-2-butanone-4-phosphate synthase [Rhodospirillales bacterium]MCB9995945.1 3,4-dihydroxy-2-butanone-4-phosphate synthase [Rhodospirillales bacterium]
MTADKIIIPLERRKASPLSDIETVIEEARQGRMVILVDDEDRENEGDLFIPADAVTPEIINFMTMYGRGLVCLAMAGEMIDRLELPMMVTRNTSRFQTAFTVSIEAREGVTTGISAADRAHTIRTAVNPAGRPDDLATPGHIFPLRAVDGGVLNRIGHTEATVDIARLAGYSSAGVLCEIMNNDGTMARLPDLILFAEEFGLKIGKICDLVEYRKEHNV